MSTSIKSQSNKTTSVVKRLVKIKGSHYIAVPPEFIRMHDLKARDGLLVQIGPVLTISPVPKGLLIPDIEMLLPYPEDIGTADKGRLKVAAFAQNYQSIKKYAEKERPDWELLELKMKTVIRDGKKYFLVTEISEASETQVRWEGKNELK